MVNLRWLELPMARTIFHGPKGVRAIEVRLYLAGIPHRELNPSLSQNLPIQTYGFTRTVTCTNPTQRFIELNRKIKLK